MVKKISIITTTYNRPNLLIECANSIFMQKRPPYEWILVIDDDPFKYKGFERMLASIEIPCPVRIIKKGRIGRTQALIEAHKRVQGNYVGWVDDDDFLAPDCIRAVAKTPGELIYTNYVVFNEVKHTTTVGPLNQVPYSWESMLRQNIVFHFRLYSMELYKAVGGINPTFDTTMDYELTLRMLKHIAPAYPIKIDELLYYYRIHSDRISRHKRKRQQENFKRAIEMHSEVNA